MARSEGKAWLSLHVPSQLMQAGVRSSSGFFGKLVVSGFGARLPNPGGGRISKIANLAKLRLAWRKKSAGYVLQQGPLNEHAHGDVEGGAHGRKNDEPCPLRLHKRGRVLGGRCDE